mgnify:CR=1 FL=1
MITVPVGQDYVAQKVRADLQERDIEAELLYEHNPLTRRRAVAMNLQGVNCNSSSNSNINRENNRISGSSSASRDGFPQQAEVMSHIIEARALQNWLNIQFNSPASTHASHKRRTNRETIRKRHTNQEDNNDNAPRSKRATKSKAKAKASTTAIVLGGDEGNCNNSSRATRRTAQLNTAASTFHLSTIDGNFPVSSTTSPSHKYNFTEWLHSVRSRSAQPRIDLKCTKDVRLDSINWKFGVPYLYTHASGCEHVVYMTNATPIHSCADVSISLNIPAPATAPATADSTVTSSVAAVDSHYPREIYRIRAVQRRCSVCSLLPAQCVVFGDRLADTNPCFFCP